MSNELWETGVKNLAIPTILIKFMKRFKFKISNLTEDCNSAKEAGSPILEGTAIKLPRQNSIRACISLLSRQTTRTGVITLADQVVASTTNFLTGVIIGRACTKEQFGLFMLGFSIATFLLNLQDTLISTPYTVYSPRLNDSAHTQFTGSTLIHQLVLSGLSILALVAGGVAVSSGIGPPRLGPIMWALVGTITFIMLRNFVRRLCFAGLRMKTALVFDCYIAIIQIGGLFLLACVGFLSPSRAYCVIGIACGSVVLGWLISNRKAFVLRLNQAIPDFKRNWSLGKWVLAESLLSAGSLYIYPWIVAGFHGVVSAGVWAACIAIASIGNPLLFALFNFLGPQIAHGYAQGGAMALRRLVFRASGVSCIIMIPFCVVPLIFGGQLVVLFYGNKYAGNGVVVSILALSLLATALGLSCSAALIAMERADVGFKVNLVVICVFLTFGVWLVHLLGLLGAAYALLIANTASSAARIAAFTILVRPHPGRLL